MRTLDNCKILDAPQGSEEWYKNRVGLWTASFFDKAITNTGKVSAQAQSVNHRLISELIMGGPADSYQSEAMLRGKELEEGALDFINFTHGYKFEPVGFMDSELGYGASPDGIDFERKVGIELKCPLPHTHITYLLDDKLPTKYTAQVQGNIWVSGLDRWVFLSYHPLIKPLIVVVERDDSYIEKLSDTILKNCRIVKEKHAELTETLRD